MALKVLILRIFFNKSQRKTQQQSCAIIFVWYWQLTAVIELIKKREECVDGWANDAQWRQQRLQPVIIKITPHTSVFYRNWRLWKWSHAAPVTSQNWFNQSDLKQLKQDQECLTRQQTSCETNNSLKQYTACQRKSLWFSVRSEPE